MEHLLRARARIKLLKYIFLSAGCSVLIAIIMTLYLKNNPINSDIKDPSLQDYKAKLAQNYSLTINQPVFEGVGNDLVPYRILAEKVTKNLANEYILNSITGEYSVDNGDVIVRAKNGVLDENNKFVILTDDVKIQFNDITFYCDKINFNLNNKEAYSNEDVEVNFQRSRIKADSFITRDSNNIVEFSGSVESNFNINNFE